MSTTTTHTTDAYIPGVCNINRAEIAYRQKAGYVISVIFVAILALLVLAGLSRWYRAVLFVPGLLAADCFLQAKNKFCVGYGAAGQHNANEGSSKAVSVEDSAANAKDKKRARQINLQAAGIGLLLTVLAFAIPQ
jgi:hypothetical protein